VSDDLDLRVVRYFTAVAEHGHFGRAADELRVAQPSLSRQIRRLEHQVGTRLLDRTPRGTRLTPAGEAFLPRARSLLDAARRASADARAAAGPERVTIGYTSGLIVTPALRALRRRHPDVDVIARHVDMAVAGSALRDHHVDALVTRLPLTSDGLDVAVLYDEPRVVVVPRDHHLAGKESVGVDDIADEPLPRMRDADPAWAAFWRLDAHRGGRPAPEGPIIDDLEDKFETVAAGDAIAIAVGAPGMRLRPDLTAVRLDGVEPVRVAVVTRPDEPSPLVAAFRRIAAETLPATAPAGG
jgi:DNA-binding transcriptional LysR family regulator